MNIASRICLGLAVFLAVAGGIYGFTSHEPAGTTNLLVAAVTFCFLGIIFRLTGRRADDGPTGEGDEVHVGPTIWPFALAISGVIVAIGLIVSPWILILGAVAIATSAAGWFRDVARSHAPASR